ncbi:MAG: hypothetical protein R3A46_10350 [Thermomicrobiales bacterium]
MRSDNDPNIYRKDPLLRRILTWIHRYREGTLDAGCLADNLFAADGAIDGSTPHDIRYALHAAANGMEGARFGIEIEDAESALASLESSITRYLEQ